MHALDVAFWLFFAAVVAWIGWTFLQLFVEWVRDRPRSARPVKRPMRAHSVTAGGIAGDSIGGFDRGDAASHGDITSGDSNDGDTSSGDSNGGDSGGGDFSGGGGESGGGGGSGGW